MRILFLFTRLPNNALHYEHFNELKWFMSEKKYNQDVKKLTERRIDDEEKETA